MIENNCRKISLCPHNNCGFRCCNFDEGNYILLFPNELKEAEQKGLSTKHLSVIAEDKLGGHKVVCKAKDTSTCDNGYKPLDCSFYPFFPKLEDDKLVILRGNKCPLKTNDIPDHLQDVLNTTKNILKNSNPKYKDWLQGIKLIGYRKDENVPEEDI